MLGELFGAESKTQVYGNFHAFLYENQDITKNVSMFDMQLSGSSLDISIQC